MVSKLYQWLVIRRFINPESIRKLVSIIDGGTVRQTEEIVESYYQKLIKKISCVILVIVTIMVIVIVSSIFDNQKSVDITRNDYGEDSQSVTLYYENAEKNLQEIVIDVDAVLYTPEELRNVFDETFVFVDHQILGDNLDFKEIRTDLILPENAPFEGVELTWSSSDYELISGDGKVHNREISKPVTVKMTLEVICQNERCEKVYTMIVQPVLEETKDVEHAQIEKLLKEQLEQQKYEKDVSLSLDSDQYVLFSNDVGGNKYVAIVLVGILIIICIINQQKSKLTDQVKNRKKQLMNEYPGFVNQIILYTAAGASVPKALERIEGRYRIYEQDDVQSMLHLELKRMLNETSTGVPLDQAYIHFGRRIGLLPYIKLMSLLLQQISRGGTGILNQLEQEEHEAFEKKKERAKKYGEEAGIKLLFPMILLMVISMILIMYPAVASFIFGSVGSAI